MTPELVEFVAWILTECANITKTIVIIGTGLKKGFSFVFEPELRVNSDYDLEVNSKNKVSLNDQFNIVNTNFSKFQLNFDSKSLD